MLSNIFLGVVSNSIYNLPSGSESDSGSEFEMPIEDIAITLNKAQYTNAPVTIGANPLLFGTVNEWLWIVKRTSDGVTIGISKEQNPSILVPDEGYYDLMLYASNASDYYLRRYRRAFRVFKPKLTDVEIVAQGGRVIDLSVGDILFYDYTGVDMSDKVIRIKNSSTSVLLQFHNLAGTPGHPCIIDKPDDNVQSSLICRSGSGHCFWLSGSSSTGCRYVTVNGFNKDGSAGMKFSGNSASTQVVYVDGKFTDIEFAGFDVSHFTNQDAAGIAMQPTVNTNNNIDNWYCDNLIYYRLTGTNIGEEFLYTLESNQSPDYIGNNGFYPPSGRGGVMAWCSVTNMGRDAYQWGCWLGYEVHNNYAENWGIQADAGGQEAGFAHNGGSAGAVFDNILIGGKYFYSVSSGLINWDKRAGETTPRSFIVINNVFSKGSYAQHGGVEPFCFYVQNDPNSGAGVWNFYIIGNMIDTDKKFMQVTWALGGFHGTDIKVVNNLAIKSGSATGSWPELEFTGNDVASTTGTVVNNLVREMGSDLSNLRFTNYTSFNYKPLDTTSSCYGGLPTDIDAYTQYAQYLYDVENFPGKLPTGYYFGPYSLYGKRVIAVPSPSDPTEASYTSGPTVTPSMFNGIVESITDKSSITYYSIVPNNSANPSYNQIMSGAGSVAYGNYMGLLDGNASFSGLSAATAYDFYYFSVSESGVESAITKIDFSTIADVTPPTLSNWTVTNDNRDRVYFDSTEILFGTTFAGFTLTGKTITALQINTGQLTGHYFTVNSPLLFGDVIDVAYSGTGSNIRDAVGNAITSISSTAVINNIQPAVEEPVVGNSNVDMTVSGASSNTFTSNDASASIRSSQIIPSGSDGYIKWDWNINTRSNTVGNRIGLIGYADSVTGVNVKLHINLSATNHNIDIYEGDTFKTTFNIFGYNQAGIRYRMKIRRSDGKIVVDATTNNFSTVTNMYISVTTFSGDLRFVQVATEASKVCTNAIIQADKGLS